MTRREIKFRNDIPFKFIGGPCVIETRESAVWHAKIINEICKRNKIRYVFKSSYDKANRTSIESFRGPGYKEGCDIFDEIRSLDIPVLTDVHSVEEIQYVKHHVDILQIPAFLCRQTDLIAAAADSNCLVNVKKGQFLAPTDVQYIKEKFEASIPDSYALKDRARRKTQFMITERGTCFGYGNLVVDYQGLNKMVHMGIPVIMDATHAVQKGREKGVTSGARENIECLARAALINRIAGLFMEVHTNPKDALSDSATQYPLEDLEPFLQRMKEIDKLAKELPRP